MARSLIGEVVSTSMDKTAVVVVTRSKTHPLYGKKYKVSRKYLVHDGQKTARLGDRVEIKETRPISRHKRWIITAKTEEAKEVRP